MMLPRPVAPDIAERVDEYAATFQAAKPVRHVVIDGFLEEPYAEQLFADLPDLEAMPKSRDYVFSDKRELSTLDRHSEISGRLHEVFMSPAFATFLGTLAGHETFVDPEYIGGGFHAGSEGSFLDLHVDFNIHPSHDDWLREFNILLYMNPGWERSWGGELLLTDDPASPTISVEPLFNRLVIMESTDKSFHGYEKISFPAGRSRRSIAAYAYSHIDPETTSRRTTKWMPREAGPVKRALAKNWNWMVLTKNKFFGSGTLKNRR
jgi:Rps23 Pro-64 3,4-dihydroxylase Tpa1-like proline 4-hydroxylase